MKDRKLGWTLFMLSVMVGLGLVFIGGRFLFAPEAGEQGFGINFAEDGNYAFHRIKGIRDLFSGLLILTFTFLNRRTALAVTLGLGALIPFADFLIILTHENTSPSAAWIHGMTAVLLLILAGSRARLANKPVTTT